MKYDLVVVGSGPAGRRGAIAAAKNQLSVAVVENRAATVGGACLHTGTIPSKTMREAILHLSGYRQRDVYRDQYRKKRRVTMADLRKKLAQVVDTELHVIHDQLERNAVDVFYGVGSFLGPHEIAVQTTTGSEVLQAEHVLLAGGTRPARPSHIPFDGVRVFDSDELLELDRIPRSLIVVGGGVIGIEYAIMFAILGVHVTVVDGRDRLLEFCDAEIIDTLLHHARSLNVVFRLGEQATRVQRLKQEMVSVELESGKRLIAENVLFSVGRQGNSDGLNLPAAGLEADRRGRVRCNEDFRTEVPHIYAVGDLVGFPALASASMEQGRRAACHLMGCDYKPFVHMPYGLFTIPEIAMVGKTEQELTSEQVPYEVGTARFNEIARGQIAGENGGLLKLLFHRQTEQLLGIHCIGESATEIVHLGQAVMSLSGTLSYFRDAVFNYPTMSEAYKVAALDGLNKLSLSRLGSMDDVEPASSPIPEMAPQQEAPVVTLSPDTPVGAAASAAT